VLITVGYPQYHLLKINRLYTDICGKFLFYIILEKEKCINDVPFLLWGKKMTLPLSKSWSSACDMLRDEMPAVSFETWVSPLIPIKYSEKYIAASSRI
jgi:hypothetical protein